MWNKILQRNIFNQVAPYMRINHQSKNRLCFKYLNYHLCRTLYVSSYHVFPSNLNSSDQQSKYICPSKKEAKPFLEKIVDKCHPGIQPYLRLIRFDKPTG